MSGNVAAVRSPQQIAANKYDPSSDGYIAPVDFVASVNQSGNSSLIENRGKLNRVYRSAARSKWFQVSDELIALKLCRRCHNLLLCQKETHDTKFGQKHSEFGNIVPCKCSCRAVELLMWPKHARANSALSERPCLLKKLDLRRHLSKRLEPVPKRWGRIGPVGRRPRTVQADNHRARRQACPKVMPVS